jgi:hypothetical protein
MTSCSLGLRGPTSPMARSVYVSASVAAMPTALASMTTTPGYFPVCRLASRTLRSNARTLADCKVLNSALKRRPTAVTSSASPPGTLRPLSKTCMSNCSANVSAIAISRGSGSLLGLMFLALLTFLWVATRPRSAGDGAFNQCPAVKKVLRHGPVRHFRGPHFPSLSTHIARIPQVGKLSTWCTACMARALALRWVMVGMYPYPVVHIARR